MRPFRVLVTGSRTWTDAEAIHNRLDVFVRSAAQSGFTKLVVVHGAAQGADMIADAWARNRKHRGWPVDVERHPADWAKSKRAAGFRRNKRMVDLGADVCLAFILNGSRGATGCADLAERAGIHVERFAVRTDAAILPDSPSADEVTHG